MPYHTAICFWYIPPRESEDATPRWLRTTVGRVLFNSILPRSVVAELGFRDELMKKKNLSELVLQSYRRAGDFRNRDDRFCRPAPVKPTIHRDDVVHRGRTSVLPLRAGPRGPRRSAPS